MTAALFAVLFFGQKSADAATLSVGPSSGLFTVGNIFDVSVILNTDNESVNAVNVNLNFPQDKLQLVSPSIGKSIVGIWATPPQFNNQKGMVILQGLIPGGINTSSGILTTLSFRVKSVGQALVKILDSSSVLLNDGRGTNALTGINSGIYQLELPPPAGPIVVSPTHPDQSIWYPNSTVVLRWSMSGSGDEQVSYMLDSEPITVPDNISQRGDSGTVYKNLADGQYYFHIKSSRSGIWGGTTHFSVRIDTTPPAEFSVTITPSERTTRQQPIIQFETSDALSGISHYEIKTIPLSKIKTVSATNLQPLFIETESPYIPPPLELGEYDVIVRAYDTAGNLREETQRLSIVSTVFTVVSGKGLQIRNIITIPWIWVWAIAAIMLILFSYLAWRLRKWHHNFDLHIAQKELPIHLKQQLNELKKYRDRYGKMASIFLLVAATIVIAISGSRALADVSLNPPIINTISRNISNDEIFYVGGKTETPQSEVIIYLQDLNTGATINKTTNADKNGDWFYRHDSFLSSGNYLLWTQGKIADEMSPPSPQIQINVRQTALQLGSSRLSYETIYLIAIIFLIIIVAALIIDVSINWKRGKRKRLQFMKEVREAEESIRRGFAVLRRDIEAELAIVKKAKLSKELSIEEKQKEEQLLKDLKWAEQYIGKEVWDVEKTEYR
ncbi:MAG: cohesin domain-containing protein [Patescibacteria group bacterium]